MLDEMPPPKLLPVTPLLPDLPPATFGDGWYCCFIEEAVKED